MQRAFSSSRKKKPKTKKNDVCRGQDGPPLHRPGPVVQQCRPEPARGDSGRDDGAENVGGRPVCPKGEERRERKKRRVGGGGGRGGRRGRSLCTPPFCAPALPHLRPRTCALCERGACGPSGSAQPARRACPPPPLPSTKQHAHPLPSPRICFLVSQVIEKREEVDWRRHMVFCTFGICYLGGFQYWLYNIQVSAGGREAGRGARRKGIPPLFFLARARSPSTSPTFSLSSPVLASSPACAPPSPPSLGTRASPP